ncbi:MAG: VWA domain-containing protein [Planctomycetota bacterium]|nr:MAG: VWA domain-containing protein [Planctomycetota bacterium]
MNCFIPLVLLALQDPAPAAAAPVQPAQSAPDTGSIAVDLALCLDTSGSMDGLIEAAKTKLWAIVNDLALARPAPRLRVALLTYGNSGHDAAAGWVQVQTPFTEDLDLVSQKLFQLRTNGGTELVGRVVRASLEQLEWNASPEALKLILVAGNESADQDQEVPFRDACRRAIECGIQVNSIYCGGAADPDAEGWKEVARRADGHYGNIDQNAVLVIATPFDEGLAALSAALNATYVPYGTTGATAWANQAQQDANAATLNSTAAAERAACKANGLYQCGWDLVDACRGGRMQLEDVKTSELPENLRNLSREELAAHLDQQWRRRSELHVQIQERSRERDQFVQAELAKAALRGDQAFDTAIRAAIRSQAQAKGFLFPQ